MREYKNIDRIFQERFRDFEVTPPESVWNHIETSVQGKSKRLRLSSWAWFGSIAVGLALLFTLNNPFKLFDSPIMVKPTFDTDIVTTDKVKTPSIESKNQETLNSEDVVNNGVKQITNNIAYTNADKTHEIITPSLENSDLVENTKLNQDLSKESLVAYDKEKEEDKESKEKRWTITTLAAPVFVNSFDSQAPFNPTTSGIVAQSKMAASYGIQVAYKLNKRLSIQSGVHIVDFTFLNNDMTLYNENLIVANASHVTDVDLPSKADLGNDSPDDYYASATARSSKPNHEAKTVRKIESKETKTKDELLSKNNNTSFVYGYIEIPIEAKYRLTNSNKFGVNLIGGFSTLLLNKKNLTADNTYYTDNLSIDNPEPLTTNYLNSVNFSGNLGLEFEYNIYRNVNFNLTPMFKVQTQTINNKTTLKPYTVGIYSGLNLRF